MRTEPTIYDVSRLSGVSTATVSRALSQPESVRESTRQKVLEAAEALRYHPNAIARAMARQRTDRVAYLICKKGATILDEFYAGICDGIMPVINDADQQLLISTAADWQRNTGNSQSKQIEGVILGGNASVELITDLQSRRVAVVLANNRMTGFDVPCVVADEHGGVQQVVEHFYEKGHRRIAMLAGRHSPYIISERYNAFLDTMKALGLEVGADCVRMCEPNVTSATQAALELLGRPDRPTAIFGSNDVVAAGAIKAGRRLGLRLPEDLAVAGFDASSICTLLEPELTSVYIDNRRMGEYCARHLQALLNGQTDVPRLTVVPTALRPGRST